jgi:hypothetical protein
MLHVHRETLIEGDIIHCITPSQESKGEYMITYIHNPSHDDYYFYAYSVTSNDAIILSYNNNELMDQSGLKWGKLYQDKSNSLK